MILMLNGRVWNPPLRANGSPKVNLSNAQGIIFTGLLFNVPAYRRRSSINAYLSMRHGLRRGGFQIRPFTLPILDPESISTRKYWIAILFRAFFTANLDTMILMLNGRVWNPPLRCLMSCGSGQNLLLSDNMSVVSFVWFIVISLCTPGMQPSCDVLWFNKVQEPYQ